MRNVDELATCKVLRMTKLLIIAFLFLISLAVPFRYNLYVRAYTLYPLKKLETWMFHYLFLLFSFRYIEASKARLYHSESQLHASVAQSVLLYVFGNILKMLHPFMPFVTEELWQVILSLSLSLKLPLHICTHLYESI